MDGARAQHDESLGGVLATSANAHTTASISEPATAVVIASPDAVRPMQ
jgi:hypothetical protein